MIPIPDINSLPDVYNAVHLDNNWFRALVHTRDGGHKYVAAESKAELIQKIEQVKEAHGSYSTSPIFGEPI